MVQITGGSVSFSRSVQPAQFESKKAEVKLDFTLGEGEQLNGALDTIALMAKTKGLEMVGLAVAADPKPGATAGAVAPTKEASAASMNAADATKPSGRKKAASVPETPAPKDKAPATDADGLDDVVEKPQISKNPEDRKPVEDADADLLGEPEKTISDTDLTGAVQRKNTELGEGGGAKIRALRDEMFPGVKSIREIAADKRPGFLEKLKGLK